MVLAPLKAHASHLHSPYPRLGPHQLHIRSPSRDIRASHLFNFLNVRYFVMDFVIPLKFKGMVFAYSPTQPSHVS